MERRRCTRRRVRLEQVCTQVAVQAAVVGPAALMAALEVLVMPCVVAAAAAAVLVLVVAATVLAAGVAVVAVEVVAVALEVVMAVAASMALRARRRAPRPVASTRQPPRAPSARCIARHAGGSGSGEASPAVLLARSEASAMTVAQPQSALLRVGAVLPPAAQSLSWYRGLYERVMAPRIEGGAYLPLQSIAAMCLFLSQGLLYFCCCSLLFVFCCYFVMN